MGFVNLVKLKIFAVDFIAAVSRAVIDDHGLVVGVVLGEYGVETVLNSKFIVIVVARRHYAHGQLSGDFGELKLLL